MNRSSCRAWPMLGAINSATQCNAMLPASAMLCCHSMQSYAATESIQNIIHAEGLRIFSFARTMRSAYGCRSGTRSPILPINNPRRSSKAQLHFGPHFPHSVRAYHRAPRRFRA